MPAPHIRSWSAAIRTYTANSQFCEALHAFRGSQRAALQPECYALAAAIKSCSALRAADFGTSLHGYAAKNGYSPSTAAEKALMDMYAKLGMLREAHQMFEEMDHLDPVAWNILLSGYAKLQLHGEAMSLFYLMDVNGDEETRPDSISVAIILPVCARLRSLKHAGSIHGYVIKTGLESDTLVGNALVSAYAKCGGPALDDSFRLFDSIACKDVVTWNSMISGCAEHGFFDDAMGLFVQMVVGGCRPNYSTLANVLPLCSLFKSGWRWGKEIHCHVLRFAFQSDVSVCNALMAHYAYVQDMSGASAVFENALARDIVSWNSLIAGYAMNGRCSWALDLFHALLATELEPDSVTVINVLPACSRLNDVQEGRKIHSYVLKNQLLISDISVGNALISFYGKCGELNDALKIFLKMPMKDLISWNSMLSAYVDNKKWDELICFYKEMISQGVRPDSVTILSVLQACAALDAKMIREIHSICFRNDFLAIVAVGNALLDAYAKCASIKSAIKTFKSLPKNNIISCNIMISAFMNCDLLKEAEAIFEEMQERDLCTWNLIVQLYAQSDHTEQAINLFHQLQHQSMGTDATSIMSILPACARLASVHLVRQCHGYAIRFFLSDIHLEGAMLDAYSKCGSIKYAYHLFCANPQKDIVIYTAMASGFAMNGMVEKALAVYYEMLDEGIKPDHVIMTTILSACSHAGLISEGWKHFKSIGEIYGMKHTMEHYACIVDLLARWGKLEEAIAFIKTMPYEPAANIWGTVLGASKIHGKVEMGRIAAQNLFDIEAENVGNYVVMSNIYAAHGSWDGVEKLRGLMKGKELKKPAGCSWIELNKQRHVFLADDLSHPQRSFIYSLLRNLDKQIKQMLI